MTPGRGRFLSLPVLSEPRSDPLAARAELQHLKASLLHPSAVTQVLPDESTGGGGSVECGEKLPYVPVRMAAAEGNVSEESLGGPARSSRPLPDDPRMSAVWPVA